jgi:molybdenum cofactor cytidylyltransferase
MSAPAEHAGGIVLAAGEAKRFGAQKLLLILDGRSMLQRVLDAANASSLDPLVVVLGADADAIEGHLRLGRARVARNPDYATGQASSLRAGLRALAGATDAAVVLLGDQPLITGRLLDRVVARQRQSSAAAVLCRQDGRRSPPALLHRDLWPGLQSLRGDIGARDLLASRDDVAVVDVPASVARLDDIDTAADWERLHAGQQQ